ncbi:HEPN domain-containing protein [Leptolyngbyaceae cyanobacterium CCMR0082]|uniref:HEPN domain-containing protein n=2 Tax=Adonisia turfae TaxID=2950184 RepID=A0A6M0SBN1_9CYAN|nr:HEPN domain-containing protein [Adonisia turfae]MDV3352706.1 HEPN domain-containing protein [Leptothoe sp. LEGE 181152]NEZ55221.1 HEPN domain-containing protein [Adonisia turfae CCMR0081]NEZ65870.1 HEPN domain-containing protein [Adonisia turfae CCMR0082]
MKSEQKQRLLNAKENIKAAQLLAHSHFYDIAISRAYYAMLYVAEALLLEQTAAVPTQNEAVNSLFSEQFSEKRPLFQPYSAYLNDGLNARLRADYSHTDKATLADAKQHINRANAFLDLGKHYLSTEIAPAEPAEVGARRRS